MISKYRFRKTAPPAKTQTTRQQGECAEQQAAEWLRNQGLSIIARNFHSRFGEIDIIGHDGEHLVFIEVRFRSNPRFGGAAATVDRHKQRKLILAAQHYLNSRWRGQKIPPCRFDVVALAPQHSGHDAGLTIHWYKAAFEQDESNYNAY